MELSQAQISALADKVMAEIHKDMRKPFPWGKQIPRNIGSFSGLHDYCDANEYLIDVLKVLATPEHYGDEDAEGNKLDEATQAAVDLEIELGNAISTEVDNRLAAEADLLSQRLVAGTLTYPLDFGVIDGDLHEMWADLHKVAQESMEGKTVTVVVTHPDEEAAEASRITMVEVHFGTDAAALDLAVNQEAFTAEIEKPGNAVHFSRAPFEDTICAGCGDFLHKGSDGRLYDTSGDPECWAFSNGPHKPRQEFSDANLASAELREADAKHYPHDDPCPRCGRRQWGLGSDVEDPMNPSDAEQETCGACGYKYGDQS
jgi:hypothetical protein